MTYFLLSLLYTAVSVIRNFLFDIGFFKSHKLPVPVISVGNITAGGSGKTPLVMLIGSILKTQGIEFAVLSRGYGRKSTIPFFAKSSRDLTALQIGDEPKMIGERLGCYLGIGANRFRIGSVLMRKFHPMPVILDDGFSHRWIGRDLDLLVIDGTNPWGKGMLPYGTRREIRGSIRRASAAVITRDTETLDDSAIRAKLAGLRFSKPLFTARRIADGIIGPDGNLKPVTDFPGTPFYLFSGIANGKRFEESVKALGLTVKGSISYPDHFIFNSEEITQIKKNAGDSKLLTTEKDFYRLGELAKGLYYIRISLVVDQDDAFKGLILNLIGSRKL